MHVLSFSLIALPSWPLTSITYFTFLFVSPTHLFSFPPKPPPSFHILFFLLVSPPYPQTPTISAILSSASLYAEPHTFLHLPSLKFTSLIVLSHLINCLLTVHLRPPSLLSTSYLFIPIGTLEGRQKAKWECHCHPSAEYGHWWATLCQCQYPFNIRYLFNT